MLYDGRNSLVVTHCTFSMVSSHGVTSAMITAGTDRGVCDGVWAEFTCNAYLSHFQALAVGVCCFVGGFAVVAS